MNALRLPLIVLSMATAAWGFPPAPHYTLFGIVRDQVGQTVVAEGAEIIVLRNGVEIGRAPIKHDPASGRNYELNVRIDHARAGTDLFSEKAIPAGGEFSLVVEMNGTPFYPIEVSGTLTVGKGSERVRLDLNLGADSDGDGLPDVWEQWQLFQAGYSPDDNGRWPIDLIDRDSDLDGDGLNNYAEYLAGTFAGDATEHMQLKIRSVSTDSVHFEFFGITGKTYTIDRSPALEAWTRVSFAIDDSPSEERRSFIATQVGIVSGSLTTTPGEVKEFYRLGVR